MKNRPVFSDLFMDDAEERDFIPNNFQFTKQFFIALARRSFSTW